MAHGNYGPIHFDHGSRQAGGFLEARFVSFVMSEGVVRDPLPWEGVTSPKVIEVRGGSVLFEAGAIGGNFVNCFFLDDRDVGSVRAGRVGRPHTRGRRAGY